MRVVAWSNGGGTYGIRVREADRDRHFCRRWSNIEVEIGGRLLEFRLTDSFWCDCPEFRGREIREWLAAGGFIPWAKRHPPAFELVPLEANRFCLVEQTGVWDADAYRSDHVRPQAAGAHPASAQLRLEPRPSWPARRNRPEMAHGLGSCYVAKKHCFPPS